MKKRWLLLGGLIISIPAALMIFLKTPVFGGHPNESDKARFSESEAFDESQGIFVNRRAELIARMRENTSTLGMLKEWFTAREAGAPATALPEQIPDMESFLASGADTRVIWFGHSTFLLNMSGAIVLVDPVFSDTAAPVNFTARRFQPPVLSLEELPDVDVVLISHDHYDHLDQNAVEHFASAQTRFIAPLGVGVHLSRWGVDAARITEQDWWQTTKFNGIEFTATPAQHFSGRDGINNNETLWASWVMVSDTTRLYFSGDSGYDTHFKEIGDRLGPFDMAFMENGQYDESWEEVHLMPEQAVQANMDLKARRLFPVHWGMFELAFHTWYDPIVRISASAQEAGIELVTPILGEVITLNDSLETSEWWKSLVPEI